MHQQANQRLQHRQSGFSLVELAIVLIVIGLIVGGVLKGRELIESAQLKSVLSQLNDYRVATATFLDRYGALPGDYNQAQEHIDSSLRDGNGDGIIDGDGLKRDSEAFQYWRHLAAAQLIPDPGTSSNNGAAQFGRGAPTARVGGGITIVYNPQSDMPGHWYLLGAENGDKGNGALLTPIQAMSLDKQIDNGNPTTGRVRATNGANAHECITGTGLYNTKNNKRVCILYFQF